MWPDVGKICVMIINFGLIVSLSVLADGMVQGDELISSII